MHRLHLVFHGRVQGVGFRWFVMHEAAKFGLAGAVWNRRDGAVEVEAEGTRENLERLRAVIRRGPSGARVSAMDETWSEGPGRHGDFHVAPSS
jgi:acylphosphatase